MGTVKGCGKQRSGAHQRRRNNLESCREVLCTIECIFIAWRKEIYHFQKDEAIQGYRNKVREKQVYRKAKIENRVEQAWLASLATGQ